MPIVRGVDVVVNTHLHFDHIGWNTMPDGAAQRKAPQTKEEESRQQHVRTVFADSISPIQKQIELWSDDHRLSESLWLRPAI